MSEQAIHILSTEPPVAQRFTFLLTGRDTGSGGVALRGQNWKLCVASPPTADPSGWREAVEDTRGMVLVTHFLDVVTLQSLRQCYRILRQREIPLLFALYREEEQREFKVSCRSCGQKLWIDDQDVGREGRCPHCRAVFRLASQEDTLRERLQLPHHVAVAMVNSSYPSTFTSALDRLVEQIAKEPVFIRLDPKATDAAPGQRKTIRLRQPIEE